MCICVGTEGGAIKEKRDPIMSVLNNCAQVKRKRGRNRRKEGGKQAFKLEIKNPKLGWMFGEERRGKVAEQKLKTLSQYPNQ